MTRADDEELHRRWRELWARSGVQLDRIPAIQPLLDAYQEPARSYHNLRHIEQCLNEFASERHQCKHPDSVELAIWYHDVVYDARRSDNEEESAQVAADSMQTAGVPASIITEVTLLILATRHAKPPEGVDAQILVDIDLSILGQPDEVFDAYERNIRQEYAFVEDQAFREGRTKVLRSFLARPTIYSTHQMQSRYESAARQNLERSIRSLAMR